jgi:hypothetical protein
MRQPSVSLAGGACARGRRRSSVEFEVLDAKFKTADTDFAIFYFPSRSTGEALEKMQIVKG